MDNFKKTLVAAGVLLVVASPIYINSINRQVEIPNLSVSDDVFVYRVLSNGLVTDDAEIEVRFYASSELVEFLNVVIDINNDGYVTVSDNEKNEWFVRNLPASSITGDVQKIPIKLPAIITDENILGSETAFIYSGVEMTEDLITDKDKTEVQYSSEQRKVEGVEYE